VEVAAVKGVEKHPIDDDEMKNKHKAKRLECTYFATL